MKGPLSENLRQSARGSLQLMMGQVASTLVSALTIIVVARLLGPEKYGVVTVVMVPIGLALLVQDLGVNTALIRFVALWRSEGRHGDVQVLVRVGLTINTLEPEDIIKASTLKKEHAIDFEDALHLTNAQKTEAKRINT